MIAIHNQNRARLVEEQVFMSMTNHAGPGPLRSAYTSTVWNSPNINTYYRCTEVIQDTPKTGFGEQIHDALALLIRLFL